MQLWPLPRKIANRLWLFRLSSTDIIVPLCLFLSLSLFCFSLKRISLKVFFSSYMKEQAAFVWSVWSWHLWSLSLELSSHWEQKHSIYFYFKHIIDCCLSSHPHLRESIYLNLTNAPLFSNFKYKWRRDRLVTRWFFYVFPLSLKKHKTSK